MKAKKKLGLMAILLAVIILLPCGIYGDNIEAILPSSDGSDAFQVQDSVGTSLMDVLSDGKVGVSTSTPKEIFQIGDIWTFSDGGWKVMSLNSFWNGANDVRIATGPSAAMAYTSLGDILFRTASSGSAGDLLDAGGFSTWVTPPFIIKNDGKVGVGTISPSGRLDIEGGDVFIGTGTLTNASASEDLSVTGNLEVDGRIYGDGSGITGISASGDIKANNGTALAPSISFLSDDDTGIYKISTNRLGFSAGGLNKMTIDQTTGVTIPDLRGTLIADDGTALIPSISFSSDSDSGIYKISTNRLGFSAGGLNKMTIDQTIGVTIPDLRGTLIADDGTALIPSISFSSDPDTGIYKSGTNKLDFSVGGLNRVSISSTGNVGIGKMGPGSKLDVMGTIRLSGAVSGFVGLAPAAAAGSTTYTLPSSDGTNGQALTTNGSGALSWAAGGGGSSILTGDTDVTITDTGDGIIAFTEDGSEKMRITEGKVGIGTTSPDATLTINGGGILAAGTTGITPVSGAGTRLMWVPAKAAFRVGRVNAGEWDEANVGINSVAMGFRTTASGNTSTAMGFNTTASGEVSTAMGNSPTASGSRSTAMGDRTTASGDTSTAMGDLTVASGINSTAMGETTTAQSYASTVLGRDNVVFGTAGSWVSTDPLFVIGNGSTGFPSNAMTVLKNGNVGIGTTSPGFPLEMASGAHVTSGGVWTDASSRDYKENIRDLTVDDAMKALDGLRPSRFNYKVDKDDECVGFIAEDVPELVATKNRKGLSPMDLTAVLTKVVQEQQNMLQAQKDTISALSEKVKILEQRL